MKKLPVYAAIVAIVAAALAVLFVPAVRELAVSLLGGDSTTADGSRVPSEALEPARATKAHAGEAATPTSIELRIVAKDTHEPVVAALVQSARALEEWTPGETLATSDGDGKATLGAARLGRTRLRIASDAFEPAIVLARRLQAGVVNEIEIERAATLRVTITNRADDPLRGVSVVLRCPVEALVVPLLEPDADVNLGSVTFSGVTDEMGTLVLAGLPANAPLAPDVTFEGTAFVRNMAPWRIEPGAERAIHWRWDPGARVVGQAIDASARPVAGIHLALRAAKAEGAGDAAGSLPEEASATTDAAGRFAFDAVMTGQYEVFQTARHFAGEDFAWLPASHRFVVLRTALVVPLKLELHPGRLIRGRVIGPESVKPHQVSVLWADATAGLVGRERVDKAHDFLLGPFDPGPIELEAMTNELSSGIVVVQPGPPEVRLELMPLHDISVSVRRMTTSTAGLWARFDRRRPSGKLERVATQSVPAANSEFTVRVPPGDLVATFQLDDRSFLSSTNLVLDATSPLREHAIEVVLEPGGTLKLHAADFGPPGVTVQIRALEVELDFMNMSSKTSWTTTVPAGPLTVRWRMNSSDAEWRESSMNCAPSGSVELVLEP